MGNNKCVPNSFLVFSFIEKFKLSNLLISSKIPSPTPPACEHANVYQYGKRYTFQISGNCYLKSGTHGVFSDYGSTSSWIGPG